MIGDSCKHPELFKSIRYSYLPMVKRFTKEDMDLIIRKEPQLTDQLTGAISL